MRLVCVILSSALSIVSSNIAPSPHATKNGPTTISACYCSLQSSTGYSLQTRPSESSRTCDWSASSYRAPYQSSQAISPHRHTLRKTGQQLFGHVTARCNHLLDIVCRRALANPHEHATGLRHPIERLINRLKQYRPIATRYEKRANNYLGM